MWGPAPAINPNQKGISGGLSGAATEDGNGNRKGKKNKKNMQRVDNSILGFTCTAATERVNVGEIENL